MIRLLCLDSEGGHGGSSRSLYYLLKNIDRNTFEPVVWCRRGGEIEDRYRAIGIPCFVKPELPKIVGLPKVSRNIIDHLSFIGIWRRSKTLRDDLVREMNENFDLIHLNHEGFAYLAKWLRPRIKRPITIHIRTVHWVNRTIFTKTMARAIANYTDWAFFISPNEVQNLRQWAPDTKGFAVHNIVEPLSKDGPIHPALDHNRHLKVLVLSNYSYLRGLDRVLDVAAVLKAQNRTDVHFYLAGDMKLNERLPGDMQAIADAGGTLEDLAITRGVDDYTTFLGHVSNPEGLLRGADALTKPARFNSPWGRDVLEGLSAGLPVIGTGTDNTFVETGKTGLLMAEFDAEVMAETLMDWVDNPETLARLAANAPKRAEAHCSPAFVTGKVGDKWKELIAKVR